jgi:hypothetical protein
MADIVNTGIRSFTRINFDHTVRLDFGQKQYDQQSICNLSLGGICINGHFEQKKGDSCEIELHKSEDMVLPVEFRAKGVVAWVNSERMAVQFTEMEHESLIFLQTALLYQADDPLLLGTEFGRDVSFQVVEQDD